ncbi:MAG: histidine kinase [Bacteroidetes bacterium]|nr:histidine kinase [Bacteroidota bacterium]
MRNHAIRFIVTIYCICIAHTIAAQSPGYKSFRIEKENRFVQINCLLKDYNGYLFVGTDDGIYTFDGDKFNRIPFEDNNKTDTVTALFRDGEGILWAGFLNGKIARLRHKSLQYFEPEEGHPQQKIAAFLNDGSHKTWFASNGEGLYYYANNRVNLINSDDGLSDDHVSCLQLSAKGDVLAGTDQGINICSIQQNKKLVRTIGPAQGLPDYIVTSIAAAGNDRYWVGTQEKGFCFYDHVSGKITIPAVSANWNYGQVNSILQDQQLVWIATQDSGLLRYSIATATIERVHLNVNDRHISCLLRDNQGNIWLRSENGLIRTSGDILRLMPLPGTPAFEHVHVLLSDNKGHTWFNNEQNELIKTIQVNDNITGRKIQLPGLTEKTDITSLYQDVNGNIWVGTMGRGIFLLSPESLAYRSFDEHPRFINASVLSINGSGRNVFVSCLEGSMEIQLPETSDIHQRYTYTDFDGKKIGTNYVYCIYKDSKGRTWFATDGKGLTLMQQSHYSYYTQPLLKDDRIYSITEDKQGNIWFSTANAGIYKYDGHTFFNYGTNEGLSDLNISVLRTDWLGHIVIVHKKGLDILDPVSGNITYITGNQGIAYINAEDLGAVSKDTAGNILVSTRNGVLTYTAPENVLEKPTALIESVQLFLADIDTATQHRFRSDENNFTFNFTGLYYTAPDQVYYKYKLEGLDSNWIITRDRSKTFPRLAPGKYVFRIQAALNKNFINASEALYAFEIKQSFYKTYWFIGGCILLAALLIYWYFKSREKELKRIERLRQEKIQFQFEVLRNQVNPHFLFNSFNTLISTIEDDPKNAAEYATQLSDFFRNVVNQRDKDIISLKDEINSLHTYFYLQQKRYGSNLKCEINISDVQQETYMIPPLTLQLLVENAVKHNAVSKETPLLISLFISDEKYLDISNNINPKINKAGGAGMGLQNIINRYRLLTDTPVKVYNDQEYFIVSLPLLR